MGFFGRVKNFFFETEAQRIIKAELETQREANKKLFESNQKLQEHNEYMQGRVDAILGRLDEQNEFQTARIDGVQRILTEIVDVQIKPLYTALSTHDEAVKDLIVAFFKDTFEKFDGLDNANGALKESLVRHIKPLTESIRDYNQFIGEIYELVKSSDEAIRSKLEMFYADMNKRFDNTDNLVCILGDVKVNPLIETAEAIRSGVGDANDKLKALPQFIDARYDSIDARYDSIKDDLSLITSTIGNVEEVVTNPKPRSDLMDLVKSVQQSVEHINGFLNSEEYKQQWDMKQVTRQMVDVRQLLEAVQAILPAPSGDTQTRILELFASTDFVYLSPQSIMKELDMTKKQVYGALSRMYKNGSLVLLSRGQYALPNVSEKLAGKSDEE